MEVLRDANQEVPAAMLDFDLNIKRKEHKLYGSFGPKETGEPMKKATKIVFDDEWKCPTDQIYEIYKFLNQQSPPLFEPLGGVHILIWKGSENQKC